MLLGAQETEKTCSGYAQLLAMFFYLFSKNNNFVRERDLAMLKNKNAYYYFRNYLLGEAGFVG